MKGDLKSKMRVTVAAVTVTLAVATGVAAAAATDWLMKINQAAGLSFSGVFVYAHDGTIETMRVVRRVQDATMQERLYSLNGEAREVVRDANRVWCYLPKQNVGVRDYRQAFESGFPRILPGDLNALKKNYRFIEGASERVADRRARRIDVIPNDDYRYGYRLWADEATGLLLRADLVGERDEVVEQYLFVAVDFDSAISDRDLQAATSAKELVWYGGEPARTAADSDWRVTQLPAGYRLSKSIRRMSPMAGKEVEHLIFTDGLSTVSVFIKPAAAATDTADGLSKMGAVNVYQRSLKNHRVTVIGEAPALTVQLLADGVTRTP